MTGAELVILLQRYQTTVIQAAYASTEEAITRTSLAAEELRKQILQAFNAETSLNRRLALAGDRLAHDLLYREHRDVLEAWWAARGGHVGKCSVCNPDAPPPELAIITTEPIACGCSSSDAWQCARATGNSMFVTCQCICHRPLRPRRAA